jgi:hypothetical protein
MMMISGKTTASQDLKKNNKINAVTNRDSTRKI